MRLGHWGVVAGAIACVAWSAVARAELLTPLEPVSPDGFEVHATQPLIAQGASVKALAAGRYFVVPEPSARQVTLTSGSDSRRLAVGPPATSVSATVTPASPVKGRDTEAQLEIVVGDSGGSAAPVLRANVGEIGAIERVGPGRYRARYRLPTTRFPEVAVIVAFSAWPHPQSVHGALGVLRVPLASAVEVPGRTEPGAEMRMTIAGSTFGPVKAAADGSFRLPVVVPPGYGTAAGETIDRVGNRRRSTIDLQLPPTDQLACVATPTRLPADGDARARVLCATSDRFGAAAKGARVQLTTSSGTLGPSREVGPGLFEWTWLAPRQRGDGVARIDARWRQGGNDSGEHLEIVLGQGPVASLRPGAEEAVAYAGGRFRGRLEARDALDRPVAGVGAVAAVPTGEAKVATSDETGGLGLEWTVPETATPGAASLELRAFGPTSTEPARLLAWGEGERSFAAVTDLAGLPVAAQPLVLDDRPLSTHDDGTVELPRLTDGEHVLRHAEWPGLQHRLVVRKGRLVYPASERPPRVATSLPVRIAPPVPVNVRLEREPGGVRWWLETASGEPVEGRPVVLTINGKPSPATSGAQAHLDVTSGSVAVQDVASRVAALLEVRP